MLRVAPQAARSIAAPDVRPASLQTLTKLTNGIDASPGAAVGRAVFTAEEAVERPKTGPVMLVRKETTPDDIHGMEVAKGILTAVGGKSSHAAVVARGMGLPCVVGAGAIHIDEHGKKFTVKVGEKELVVKEGDWISMDGATADVYLGQAKTKEPDPKSPIFVQVHDLGGRVPRQISACAPMPTSRAMPKPPAQFGAEGIGLCRTEHMFFAADRIPHMQAMILAEDEKTRKKALQKLLPMQRKDFAGLFEAMDGFPVIIRTLDPPLHEFLPKREEPDGGSGAAAARAIQRPRRQMSEGYGIPVGELKKQLPAAAQARGRSARVQSDAGIPRLPLGHPVSRDHRDAGPRDFRSRRAGGQERHQGDSRSHDSSRRLRERIGDAEGDRGSRSQGSPRKGRHEEV